MQKELLPGDAPDAEDPWRPKRAIPPIVRKFGKFPNTKNLNPGDLILTREMKPDWISEQIKNTQLALGYGISDSRWTHAAVYVGDGLRVIEATFDSVIAGGSVKLTNIYDYCGEHALRFLRPSVVTRDPVGWTLALEAATNLGAPYDFAAALKIFFVANRLSDRSWDAITRNEVSPGVVCSTLYADCYARVTRKCLGDSGTCVPAYLSCCDDFIELDINWRPIA